MPLQYLLSDAILCLGGSTELVKIFNGIGAVASLDTHDCIATCAVTEQIAKGICFELEPRSLTVVSIDNIDILQRHAMVSSTESKSRWHGTSVQSVQPMPKGIVLSEHEFDCATKEKLGNESATKTKNFTANSRKQCSSSPAMSPAPKQIEKRRRTLREHSTSHTTTQLAGRNEISSDMLANMYEYTAYQRPNIFQFTIRSFRIINEEEDCLVQL